MRCAIFQINNNLLISQQNNNSFTKEFLYLPFTSTKMTPSITKVFRNIQVLPHVHYISINADFLLNLLKNNFYLRNLTPFLHVTKMALSIAESFRNIHFLPHFYQFSQWVRCPIFKINKDLLINQQNIKTFTRENLYPYFISKKTDALHRKDF